MFAKTLSKATLRAIEVLGKSDLLDKTYLARGTALALHLGHRESVDLDFFTTKPFNEKIIERKLNRLGNFETEDIAWRTLLGQFMKVKFSLFYYQHPLIGRTTEFKGLKIASVKDIAAMKLQTIGDRGSKRDFIDLFFISRRLLLKQAFELYGQKFGKLEERKYHLLRGLRYFEDAEIEAMPKMLKKVDWKAVKQYFQQQVRLLAKEWKISEKQVYLS